MLKNKGIPFTERERFSLEESNGMMDVELKGVPVWPAQLHSSVAQWQSIRLLTEGL